MASAGPIIASVIVTDANGGRSAPAPGVSLEAYSDPALSTLLASPSSVSVRRDRHDQRDALRRGRPGHVQLVGAADGLHYRGQRRRLPSQSDGGLPRHAERHRRERVLGDLLGGDPDRPRPTRPLGGPGGVDPRGLGAGLLRDGWGARSRRGGRGGVRPPPTQADVARTHDASAGPVPGPGPPQPSHQRVVKAAVGPGPRTNRASVGPRHRSSDIEEDPDRRGGRGPRAALGTAICSRPTMGRSRLTSSGRAAAGRPGLLVVRSGGVGAVIAVRLQRPVEARPAREDVAGRFLVRSGRPTRAPRTSPRGSSPSRGGERRPREHTEASDLDHERARGRCPSRAYSRHSPRSLASP